LIGDQDREAFVVVHLNAKHKIVSLEVVAIGTLSATLVHPREVFKGALLANAAAIGLAHNHPSGDPTPSPEDLALTAQLLAAGEVVGVRVLDHIVIGDDCHVSIRETTHLWQDQAFHR
jgi:DNA repair protein RadC